MSSLEGRLTNEVVQLNAMIVALQDRVGYLEGEEIPSLERRLVELERRILVPAVPVVIDLTMDDDEETVVSDSEVDVLEGPVWPWREVEELDNYVPPPGLLVPIQDGDVIEENGRSTPQIVGEAERRFAQMEERGRSMVPFDEEADRLVEQGVAPEYDRPPSYFE